MPKTKHGVPVDTRRVWKVHEVQWNERAFNTYHISAWTRDEAKELYTQKYKRYPHTTVRASMIGWEGSSDEN